MRTATAIAAVVTIALSLTVAQQPKESAAGRPDKRLDPAAEWRARANRFTDSALEDEWRLREDVWPVLPARLAEVWWKVDPVRAHNWLAEAVSIVTRDFKSDNEEVRSKRLDAAQTVFRIANSLDREAADRVLKFLSAAAENDTSSWFRSGLGITVSSAARDAVRSDPERALQLGSALVSVHNDDVAFVVANLAEVRPDLANRLFTQAVTAAQADYDPDFLFALAQVAYPIISSRPSKLPDELRAQVLNAVAAGMLRLPQDEADEQRICALAQTAQVLLDKFPPEQMGMVQQAIQACKAKLPADRAPDSPSVNCLTADDCLTAAELEKAAFRRASLKMRAAHYAASDKKLVRALDIVDGLSPEEREAYGPWESNRTNFVGRALEQLYAEHDSDGIQRIFDKAPDHLRGSDMVQFAATLAARNDLPYALLMLSEAQRTLEKYPSSAPLTYIGLLSLYVRLAPTDAVQGFRSVVTGLNQTKYPDIRKPKPGQQVTFSYSPPGARLEPISIAPLLIEKDEPFITASIKELDDPRARIAFRLGAIQSCLRRYEEEKKKPRAPLPTTSK